MRLLQSIPHVTRSGLEVANPFSIDALLWMPLNSEAEQRLLRVVDRVVFHKPALNRRVNTVARYCEPFSIVADLKYVVMKRAWAVKVSRLTPFVGVRVPLITWSYAVLDNHQ
jgi:hypothetical protein